MKSHRWRTTEPEIDRELAAGWRPSLSGALAAFLEGCRTSPMSTPPLVGPGYGYSPPKVA